ncbi:MAG: 2-phosphosulfolactate phosphatase [Bacteroidetes bacterium]|nr:MAG: 2-phosphosulfolactate phosphatase [Bacteroidota bacterium]
MHTIEVCFTPSLFPHKLTEEDYVVVVTDILRASTSIVSAFTNGVKAIIPVSGSQEARAYKQKGYLVAAERDGVVLDFADFGNSAFNFMTPEVRGKVIAYSTTNGTKAIKMASEGAVAVAVGAFSNLTALSHWLHTQKKNVVILCAGWKQKFNLEDSFYAGALVEQLMAYPEMEIICDAAHAALDIWRIGKENPAQYIEKALHRHRLKKLSLDDVIPYSLELDITDVVPVLRGDEIVNVNISEV